MSKLQITIAGLILALCAIALAACGGVTEVLPQHANAFAGGTLSNFGGLDSGDPDLRDIAREIASSRTYDFTPSGFSIVPGAASSQGLTGSPYTVGSGSIAVNAGTAEVTLNVLSSNPAVTDIVLVGTFAVSAAQDAIINPGATFPVTWDISFTYNSIPVHLTAEQQLTGTDFQAV